MDVLRLRSLDSKTERHSLPWSCLGTGEGMATQQSHPAQSRPEDGASSHPAGSSRGPLYIRPASSSILKGAEALLRFADSAPDLE